MSRSAVQRFLADSERERVYQQERLILEVTERICQLMEEKKITRSELAKRLGTSKGYITQLLDGTANMTLRKLSDVFTALGAAAVLQVHDLKAKGATARKERLVG